MQNIRHDHELPGSIAEWDWQYHHLGIPANIKRPDEKYILNLKCLHRDLVIVPLE